MATIYLQSMAAKAAKLTLIFGDEMNLDFLKSGVSLQDGKIQIRVFEQLTSPTESAKGWARVRVVVEPFQSGEEAREAGYRVVDALLSFAVAQKVSFSFEESAGAEIVEVIECGGIGVEGRAEGRSFWPVDGPKFTELLAAHWRRASDPLGSSERTSLAFFSSAQMEVSIEARFILLMTALESFCEQRSHSGSIDTALGKAVDALVAELGSDHPQLDSLKGQIKGLKRESVAQSIKRTLGPLLTTEQLCFVVKAYGYRSKLLHEGVSIPRIHEVNTYLRDILRIVYSKKFGWELRHPVYPSPAL
ncbi:MAG: hypothetical protein CMK71_11310 [Pseudomonadaceae bacterium]|nr:hypothetical protein [Pseudomonadaceae bacterium]